MSTNSIEHITILSPREKEVALLIAEGVKNNDIAKKLSIKSNTVSTIKKNIFVKLNIESVVGLYKIINP
jgi:DNA-binding NarL/FixJ family response regulator